jgi:hypothetical protein
MTMLPFSSKNFFITLIGSWLLSAVVYTIYYPRLQMYLTSYQLENNQQAKLGDRRFNQLSHRRALAGAQDKAVVRPNNDTLYSGAWIDLSLSSEPLVLTIPEVKDRYYSFQFIDMDTNVFLILGSKNKQSGHFVITNQQWQGTLPANTQRLILTDDKYWLLARYLVRGADDLANVHALQNAIGLTTLSEFITRNH